MSQHDADAATYLEIRLRQDDIVLDEEERARLIEMLPITRGWVAQIGGEETRHAEPALTRRLPQAEAGQM
jgi:hypothetical protein